MKSFNEFINEKMDMSSIFKALHGALNIDELVPLSELIGKPRMPTEEDVKELTEFLGIERDYLFYDKNNPLNPIIYLKGPFYYAFHGFSLDIVKMMRAKEYFEQKNKFFEDALKKKDYVKIFMRVDKKMIIPYFIKVYKEIPDDQKYDVFTDLYVRSEYGFDQFPKNIIDDLFSKRHLSQDWKNRMAEFKKDTDGSETIRVYRGETGKSTNKEQAYSWTLSKKTAEYFANRFSGKGTVLERNIKATDVLDYLQDRGESEVLIMPNKFLKESRVIRAFEDFEPEPLGLAILGAPAGGKSYTKKLVAKITELVNIARATDPELNMDLTVDILRGQILQMKPADQLSLFYMAFYTMKEMSEEDSDYEKWFDDIKSVWKDKIGPMIAPEVMVGRDLTIDGKSGEEALKVLSKVNAKDVISKLDDYKDYKRIVRAYQKAKQEEAEGNKKDVVFDEVGDEPKKIIDRMKSLRKKDYVTDVIMVHHEDVATNLLQNAQRMIVGTDGGRDSSESIIDAYENIDKTIMDYEKHAEVTVTASNKELQAGTGKAAIELAKATAKDNHENPDKTIDVFVRTKGEPSQEVFDRIMSNLDPEQQSVFTALVKYQIESKRVGVPAKPKQVLQHFVGDITDEEALNVLIDANAGVLKHDYKFQFGGVSDKLLKDAKETLRNGY